MQKTTIGKLKKEADRVVSLYVRQNNPPICYTCGKRFDSWKQLQCGHFVTRQKGTTRYDLDNLRPQCVGCNYFGQQSHVFALKLLEELGEERFKALIKRGNTTRQFKAKELEEIIKKYK